jgi:small-conductance mechanosensitive channel
MMKSTPALFALIAFVSASAIAAEPSATPSPSPTPSPAESTAAALTQSVAELSAQRAAAERSQIYQAGADYSRWLDQVAKDSGSEFLQKPVYDRITWMRLFASVGVLALLSILAVWFLWIVRRRAGLLQSKQEQSWLAVGASAIRKPLALFVLVVGGAFALIPIVNGIAARPTRIFWTRTLTGIVYAGEIIALLWLVFRVALAIEKRMQLWAARTDSVLGKVIVPIAGHTLRLTVPLLGIILLLPLLRLPEEWAWVTQKGFGVLFIVALSFLIIRGINAVQLALMSRHRMDAEDNLPARRIYTQVSVIRKIIVTTVVIIATGSILMLFDPVRQFGTSILASAGIAGIVLGFAAQKTLGNVLAGIQIALSQPLLIDDIVVVEGEFGQIEEITLTFVTVRTWDLRRIVLPITYFIEKPFQNWSRVSTDLLGTVILHLDYQAPLGELRKELKRLVQNNPKWDGKVCGLQVTDTTQSAIVVRALVSSTNPGKLGDLRCEVREGLIDFLRREHPESLPKMRNVDVTPDEEIPRKNAIPVEDSPRRARTEPTRGTEHEKGDKSPGVHPEAKSDGANADNS